MTEKEEREEARRVQIGQGINAERNRELKERLDKLEAQHRANQERNRSKRKLVES